MLIPWRVYFLYFGSLFSKNFLVPFFEGVEEYLQEAVVHEC